MLRSCLVAVRGVRTWQIRMFHVSSQHAWKDEKKKKSKSPLSAEEQQEADQLAGEIEVYKHKLKTEFGYSNKDIKIDPELQEMEAAVPSRSLVLAV